MYKNLINSINNSSSSLTSACNNASVNKSPSSNALSYNDSLVKKSIPNQINGINHKINNERISLNEDDVEEGSIHSSSSINYEKLINILLSTISSSANTSINNVVLPKLAKLIDSVDRHLELNNRLLEQSLSKKKEYDMIEMTRKTNDQNHRQKLQELLIKCLNESVWTLTTADLKERIKYINACLLDTSYNKLDNSNQINDFPVTQSTKRKLSPVSIVQRPSYFSPASSLSNQGRNQNSQTNNVNRLEKAKNFFSKYTRNMNGETDNHGDDDNNRLDDDTNNDHIGRSKPNLIQDSTSQLNDTTNCQDDEFESLTNGNNNDHEHSHSNGLHYRDQDQDDLENGVEIDDLEEQDKNLDKNYFDSDHRTNRSTTLEITNDATNNEENLEMDYQNDQDLKYVGNILDKNQKHGSTNKALTTLSPNKKLNGKTVSVTTNLRNGNGRNKSGFSAATEYIRARNLNKRHSIQMHSNRLSINSLNALNRSGRIKSMGEYGKPIIIGPQSPIRHLICSPGLELKDYKFNIIVMFMGSCGQNCNEKKDWTSKVHMHYIVNTVNCNDHISRLVKKLGFEFYNSFVLQTKERELQLISTYNMHKV